jgi:hypothetical protein
VCVTALYLGLPTLYKLETVIIRSSMNWGVSRKKIFRKVISGGITKKGYATIAFLKNFSLNRAIWGSFIGLYLVFTGSNLVQFYILVSCNTIITLFQNNIYRCLLSTFGILFFNIFRVVLRRIMVLGLKRRVSKSIIISLLYRDFI